MPRIPKSEHSLSGSPKVIGLTGGIAAGKSTVSQRLLELGAHIIDADSIGHAVMAPDGEAYQELVAAFGTKILDTDGIIIRQRLSRIVFADPEQLERLNAISHPHMATRMHREIEAVRNQSPAPPLIVLDAAVLFQAGWDSLCDQVWTVSVTPETATARLGKRNNLTTREARARLAAQWSNQHREARAQKVIHNEKSLSELIRQVDHLWVEALDTSAA